MALFDENMAVGKSKYLVILYLYKLTQPSDPLIWEGPLIKPYGQAAFSFFFHFCQSNNEGEKTKVRTKMGKKERE